MTNTHGPSIYIPNDKNIFDALQHKKVTHSTLLEFLRKRGVFLSSNIEKDELVSLIASLTLDYHDYLWLCKQLENPNRKDKTTHSVMKGEVSNEQIMKACKTVKANIGIDDSVKIVKKGDTTSLVVTYVDIDFTKTELRQRTVKKCVIELEKKGQEITIKRPANKKGNEILEKVKTVLIGQNTTKLEEAVISLEGFAEAKVRSEFFDYLIRNVKGYKFDNVSSVDVYHQVDELGDEDDKQDARLAGYINKAALAGQGVLESQEFNQLHKRGFFICKIIWTVDSVIKGGDRAELEAQFGTPKSCTDFKYTARGVFNYNERTMIHNVTRRPTSSLENDELNSLLKDAAERAYDHIKTKYGI